MKSDSKIISIFKQVEDPRSHINQLHNLIDILLIADNFGDLWSRNMEANGWVC